MNINYYQLRSAEVSSYMTGTREIGRYVDHFGRHRVKMSDYLYGQLENRKIPSGLTLAISKIILR